MQLNLPKRPLWAGLMLVAVAAATVVVAGYVDKPGQAVQVAAQDQCSGCPVKGTTACCQMQCDNCPRQGTEACCQAKAAGTCDADACPIPCTGGACAGQTAGCGMKAQAGCPMSGCQGPVQSPCGAQGCPHAE
jgi:hypothetical protein